MARRTDFSPVLTTAGWMVSVPPGMSSTGKRVRRFFGTDEKAAKKFAASVREMHSKGLRGGLIEATVAMQAVEALKILEPCGLSLVEAARMAAAACANTGAAASRETFKERWTRTMLAGEMVWSDVYARDMGKVPLWVGEEVMATRCAELTRERLTEAVVANGTANAGTVKMKMLRVMSVMSDRVRAEARPKDVQILTPAQAARVLRVCERKEERWVVALLLFAGIRPDVEFGEIGRLEWDAVGERDIYISGEVAKTSTDRHIPICPRLRRLLRGHPATGRVIPSGWKKGWQRIRRESGIAAMADVCRHTFASAFLAAHGEHEAKQALGHTEKSRTLFRFYRRAVTREAGLRYLGEGKNLGNKAGSAMP